MPTSNVFIHGIKYNGNKLYMVEIGFENVKTSYEVHYSALGLNLRSGVTYLKLSDGGSFPGALSPVPAELTYSSLGDGKILPTKLEITVATLQKFKNNAPESSDVHRNGSRVFIHDTMPLDLNLSKFKYLKGYITEVTDGDTVKINVTESNIDNKEVGSIQKVRLVGINTTESPKEDADYQADTVRKNTAWLKKHGLGRAEDLDTNLRRSYKHAAESKAFIQQEVMDKNYPVLAIADDYTSRENGIVAGSDIYGRLLAHILYNVATPGTPYGAVSINKSLLASTSTEFPGVPLADIYYFMDKNGEITSTMPLATWTKYVPGYQEALIEMEQQKMDASYSAKDMFLKEHNLKEAEDGTLVYDDGNRRPIQKIEIATYRVTASDSLDGIAEKFTVGDRYTTAEDILKENGMEAGLGAAAAADAFRTGSIAGKEIKIPIYKAFGDSYKDYMDNKFTTNVIEIPADTVSEDYAEHRHDDRDTLDNIDRSNDETVNQLYSNGFTRIGDCTFVVPPLSIRIDTISSARKINTLRSKSSMSVNNGHSTKIITMSLFFANQQQVNGYPIDMKNINETWYRNGLRPLIAQFKRAPFLPIDNEVINAQGIYAVAFRDIELQTVAGFPGCVEATLSLYEFDHSVYMPYEEDFSSCFNWKLFRWYYQRIMQPPIEDEHRTYLQSVDVLDDSINFYIPDEDVLAQRQQAISDFAFKIVPSIFEAKNADEQTAHGQLIADSRELASAKSEQEIFRKWLSSRPSSIYPKLYNNAGVFDPIGLDSIDNIDVPARVKYYDAIYEYFSTVMGFDATNIINNPLDREGYRGSGANPHTTIEKELRWLPNHVGRMINFLNVNHDSIRTDANAYNILKKADNEESLSITSGNERFWMSGIKLVNSKALSSQIIDVYDKNGGKYVLDLTSVQNTAGLKPVLGMYYMVSPSDVQVTKTIEQGGQDVLDAFSYYEHELQDLNYKAHMTEEDIPIVHFPINDLIVTQIRSKLSNVYSETPILGMESPTLQYLGSQDTSIEIVIVTKSKEALRALDELVSTTHRISRDYRIAITSGVLTIRNRILDLLGVKDFIIEAMSVQTNDNMDKESFTVTLSMMAFDKTQRRRETLDFTSMSEESPEGFEAFKRYTERKRNNEGFEYGVVDLKLKELEIYPDLELPTYREVNTAIPKLGIYNDDGTQFMEIPNPTGGKFVDPDFYVRASETHRQLVANILSNDMPMMYMEDTLGLEAVEFGPDPSETKMSSAYVSLSKDSQDWADANIPKTVSGGGGGAGAFTSDNLGGSNAMDAGTAPTRVEGLTTAYGDVCDGRTGKAMANGTIAPGRFNYLSQPEIDAYKYRAKNADKYKAVSGYKSYKFYTTAESVICERPGAVEVASWNGIHTVSALSNLGVNPKKEEVEAYLYELVQKKFPNHPSDRQKIYRKSKCATYMYGTTELVFVSAPEITQDKIYNVLRAMVDHESGIAQFWKKGGKIVPKINTSGGNFAIGLGQLNICKGGCGIAKDMQDARRLAWDWKYNLERMVDYFSYGYNQCMKSTAVSPAARENPLDYAIIYYNHPGAANPSTSPTPSAHPYWCRVMNVFKARYGDINNVPLNIKPINPSEIRQIDESSEYLRQIVSDVVKNQPKSKRADGIPNATLESRLKNLKDGAYRSIHVLTIWTTTDVVETFVREHPLVSPTNAYVVESWAKERGQSAPAKFNLAVFDSYGQFARAMVNRSKISDYQCTKGKDLSKKDKLSLCVYEHINQRFEKGKPAYKKYGPFDWTGNVVVIKQDACSVLISAAYKNVAFDDIRWEDIYTIVSTGSSEIIDIANQVRSDEELHALKHDVDNIPELYRESFRDILEYDHRGRLIRAFPTFQMFVIDEGKWMAWHKMWDSFYGYNSIVSISVMKDRRFVADTATIEMTNVYGNLTAHDAELTYGEWEWKFEDLFQDRETWTKIWRTMLNLPTEEADKARRQPLDGLALKPGARISLRMGYGANAYDLPVVFNGTITEMDTQEVMTVIAQGDGIELTNKMQADPDETTDPGILSSIKEPRRVICDMLTSKGSYWKNKINSYNKIEGMFFNNNPLGIVHFGNQILPPALLRSRIFNSDAGRNDYGEAGLNVYSAAGYETQSQLRYTEGENAGEDIGYDWLAGLLIPWPKGDEPNVQIYMFDKTPWDVCQIYAACCPDYVATIAPFEYRSTLFFGKPWWGFTDKYEYELVWDNALNAPVRRPIGYYRRPFAQNRFYSSDTDIIGNGITATSDYMYTNVIGIYNEADGQKSTVMQSADMDIDLDKQTTATIHIPIQASQWATNWATQEKYAEYAAKSALKDYMKEMYQGELIVLGDPAAKPYDTIFLDDKYTDMNGIAEVKRVIHHMSFESGFITTITPDCSCIVEDTQAISMRTWVASTVTTFVGYVAGKKLAKFIWKSLGKSSFAATLRKYGTNGVEYVIGNILKDSLDDTLGAKAEVSAKELGKFITNLGSTNKQKVNWDDVKQLRKLFVESEYKIFRYPGKVTDEALKAISKVMAPFIEMYKSTANPAKISKMFDEKIWGKAKWLNKAKLFENEKGLLLHLCDSTDPEKKAIRTVFIKKGEDAAAKVASLNTDNIVYELIKTEDVSKGFMKGAGNLIYKGGTKAANIAGKAATVAGIDAIKAAGWIIKSSYVLDFAVGIALDVMVASIVERYSRKLQARQAVVIMPLRYRGRTFTAGVNGHQGLVTGDSPSGIDAFFSGTGFLGGGISLVYTLFGVDVPDYTPPKGYEAISSEME